MPDTHVAAALTVLEGERDAIRVADFDKITALATSKQKIFDQLASQEPPRADLLRLKRALVHNQTLLAAAIEGVSAARNRLKALGSVREGLSVYDRTGKIATVATRQPGIERKA